MGLISENKGAEPCSPLDIRDKDHLGDMDFKVTGRQGWYHCAQMDIKVDGLSYEILESLGSSARRTLCIFWVGNHGCNASRT